MTAKIAAAARARRRRRHRDRRRRPRRWGPASIEGYYDEALAVPGLLTRSPEASAAGADAAIIACFDDTGLDAARALADIPVIGICEAACHMAALHRPALHRRHHPVALAVPIEAARPRYGMARAAPGCAPPTSRCCAGGPGLGRRREARAARSRAPSRRTGPRRSCSAAPAWPISPPPRPRIRRAGDRRRRGGGEAGGGAGGARSQDQQARRLCVACGQALFGRLAVFRAARRGGITLLRE